MPTELRDCIRHLVPRNSARSLWARVNDQAQHRTQALFPAVEVPLQRSGPLMATRSPFNGLPSPPIYHPFYFLGLGSP